MLELVSTDILLLRLALISSKVLEPHTSVKWRLFQIYRLYIAKRKARHNLGWKKTGLWGTAGRVPEGIIRGRLSFARQYVIQCSVFFKSRNYLQITDALTNMSWVVEYRIEVDFDVLSSQEQSTINCR